MVETWRLLDTGLASAARNIALNRALLEARAADEIPSTLRFLRYAPSVLVGSRQSTSQEADLAECRRQGVAVQRRVSGGGAWLVDERQLGWELYLHRRDTGGAGTQAAMKRVGHAAATGLAALGIDARYRARDEIEVEGRSLCAMACAVEREALLVQGVLGIECDYAQHARLVRGPGAPAEDATAAALRLRTVGARELLGRRADLAAIRRNVTEAFESEFEVELREGELSLTEDARYSRALAEIETADWVELVARPQADMARLDATRPVRGGLLRAQLKYERSTRTLRQIWFTHTAAGHARTLRDLESVLCDCPMERLVSQVERFFAGAGAAGAEPHDFVAVVRLATGESLAA